MHTHMYTALFTWPGLVSSTSLYDYSMPHPHLNRVGHSTVALETDRLSIHDATGSFQPHNLPTQASKAAQPSTASS